MSAPLHYDSVDKMQSKLKDLLQETVTDTLLENRIPLAIADKLSRQVSDNVDIKYFYELIEKNIKSNRFPKQRILDRTIVHMFEVLYQTINVPMNEKIPTNEEAFFRLVPRGECLDLFLQLVKEYCMGDEEIERYTSKIEPMIISYNEDNSINWEVIYASDAFKEYLDGLLKLILSRLRKDKKPIPALENKMPLKYKPYRINSFLNQACLIYEKNSNTDISEFLDLETHDKDK